LSSYQMMNKLIKKH